MNIQSLRAHRVGVAACESGEYPQWGVPAGCYPSDWTDAIGGGGSGVRQVYKTREPVEEEEALTSVGPECTHQSRVQLSTMDGGGGGGTELRILVRCIQISTGSIEVPRLSMVVCVLPKLVLLEEAVAQVGAAVPLRTVGLGRAVMLMTVGEAGNITGGLTIRVLEEEGVRVDSTGILGGNALELRLCCKSDNPTWGGTGGGGGAGGGGNWRRKR